MWQQYPWCWGSIVLACGDRREKSLFPTAVLEMPARVRTGLMAPDGSRRGAWRWFNCAFAIAMVVSVCS